ncbi:MAG: MBL fold metallo-hydrolase [Chloroflexota bacterium]
MRIKFYAHASFRLEGDGLNVITDPYRPDVAKYEPIAEPADIVLMSSHNDRYHSDPSHITGAPTVVNTLALDAAGETIKGLYVKPFHVTESEKIRTYEDRDPDDNAMYLFTLDGIRILHMGDIGHAVPDAYLDALKGQVDVMFSLTGDHYTIPLDELDDAIGAIQPKVVIPMHYNNDRCPLQVDPVTSFTDRYPAEQVRWVNGAAIELSQADLPTDGMQILVFEESR